VIDISKQSAVNADYELTVADVTAWESQHGRIPPRSWVLLRTDWSKKSGRDYVNMREDGQHTPGPCPEVVRFLVEERDLHGLGTETIGTDAGQAFHFNPPYPAHYYMHGKGRYGLQCLTNLDLLPPTGAVIVAAPLKIRRGSGSPLRVLALVPRGERRARGEATAIVTGASGGIGAAIAKAMLERGYRVVSLARTSPTGRIRV
jgi:kynurenine formamidase